MSTNGRRTIRDGRRQYQPPFFYGYIGCPDTLRYRVIRGRNSMAFRGFSMATAASEQGW